MVDTSVLEADAEMREGSSPFPGTISIGEDSRGNG